MLTGLAGVTLLARRFHGREHGIADALPFLIGGALGIVLSLSWTWWVYGDFATLGDKFFRRSGESNTVGIDDMVSFQIPWLAQLLGLGLVGLAGCVVALWDRRFRPLAAMSLGIVIVYAVIFRQAAAGHQYWNYWALIPTAVGFAWAFDRLARDLPAARRGAGVRGRVPRDRRGQPGRARRRGAALHRRRPPGRRARRREPTACRPDRACSTSARPTDPMPG